MNPSGNMRENRFACRAALREALSTSAPLAAGVQAHVDNCAFCRARVAARMQLLPLLRQRPAMPAGVSLERVHERVVELAESGPLGAALASAVPLPAADLGDACWPTPLLASDVAQRAIESPAAVGPLAWSRVRASILRHVAGDPARRRRRRWWIGVVGTAAAASLVLALARHGDRQPPSITFQDLTMLPAGAAVPSVDFAVVRYGATR
jgi:hypothetical protein